MWWAENGAFWLPVQSKPPLELSSPAGTFLGCASPARNCTSLNSAGCVCPQLCIWHLSVEEGHVITLSFRNFSLETQDVCEFDYVEVHDSLNTGTGRVLGRWDAPITFFNLVCETDVGFCLNLLFEISRLWSSHNFVYLFQVLWWHLSSRFDVLRPPHDRGVCGRWGSRRQRIQCHLPGCVVAGQWAPAAIKLVWVYCDKAAEDAASH